MQVTGMLYGSKLSALPAFPFRKCSVRRERGGDQGADRSPRLGVHQAAVQGRRRQEGQGGLLGRASDLKTALKEKERLYFVEHRHGNQLAKANGVTFEGAVPAEHEVYFSLTDSTQFRAPTMTLTHHGGMDIEEVEKSQVAQVPFDPLTGFKAFVVANALSNLQAPKEIISPLVQHLPKLWSCSTTTE
jgi:succinyl-CoA synthetase beta subunit